MTEPTWKEVDAYLQANGVKYPWDPRDTYRALKERDQLRAENSRLQKLANGCMESQSQAIGDLNDHLVDCRIDLIEKQRDAYRRAAEIGDCPPLCSMRLGCTAEKCVRDGLLGRARQLESEGESDG
jgi:hypothetical protein